MPLEAVFVMALALGVGGLVKGATGMGLPIVALPVLAAFLGVPSAVALMSLPIFFTNAVQVWRLRSGLREADFLPGLIAAGVIGVGIGTWLIVTLAEERLSLVLGLILLAYVALRLLNPHFSISRSLGRRLAPPVGLAAGVLQGATGISSPIGVTFIHALRLPRELHVGAVSTMFLLFSVVQVPALAVAGVLTWPLLVQSALAMAPALLMMPVGTWLAGRLSQQGFDALILGLLAVMAVQLLAKSFGF